ncbi:2291_t:CDS:2, partial [Entrophospora sp. SA101]
ILKLKHIRIISSWIDKKDQYFYNNTKNLPFTFKLLFSTTRDGFSIRKFHRLCDDKGSTLTITRLNNDHQIIGGYNPVNWKPFDELKTFDKKDIIIARVHDSNNAIFYNSQTGPGFGSGPDLYIKNNLLISFHSSSPGSPFSPLSPISPISTANSLNTKHSSSSLHRIKSLERMISIKNDNENINKNRNTHALNKFQNDSSKRRKHQAQDLIDFLNTTPPSEKTTFPDSLKDHPDSNNTSGKKTKLRRFASALVNRQRAKYIKIEIPPLPVKDTSGQTSFDQLGVQSKYVPKAISTSSLPYDPNNPNNTNTGDNSLVKVSTALDSNYRTENS